ncbi:hypothetical protein WR25_23177 [Diploscapter pachys]|uniref:EKC/KEOPS complex subunit CGI121 n=1 Tax=Diploscapter pachys TaxID=2018661 RepID=A0A2A2LZN2_9BILA|nr:hypothetical protein WR25_23177 [Diploscapter pachys]
MSPGVSRLYELQPDPYDDAQRRCMRVCLFTNVQNAKELREMVRDGKIDASLIRAELVYEPFVLLAAANRAVHQVAHNRMSCRSMHAELIYSLSPSRNINDSLVTFGIAEKSTALIAAIFDDKDGSKMKKLAKLIKGKPEPMENHIAVVNTKVIKKIYQVGDMEKDEDLSDHLISRLITKDFMS